ncbi:phospholipase A2 [Streptomyces angustmyceticus]|uniref:phospholipase A2 n=1 Tax=Streptomyces angustmyceticus TaxID=285578 RepID=UPI00344D4D97
MHVSRLTLASLAGASLISLATAAPALATDASAGRAAAPARATTAPAAGHDRAAQAGPSKNTRLKRLYQLTRGTTQSAGEWRLLRAQAQSGTNPYRFIWSTDYCTRLADKPGGFDFRLSCARHDFGYRNYKALLGKEAFKGSAHEKRVDKAFLFDMNRQCRTQSGKTAEQRRKCLKTAKAYYDRVS